MSDRESIIKLNNYRKEHIFEMDSKVANKHLIENKISTVILTEPSFQDPELKQVVNKNTTFDKDLEKENVQDNKENNPKNHENNAYITIRIYDTYFGHQQPQELPHQQEPLHRQSVHRQYQNQYGGGFVGSQGGDPLVYDPSTRNSFVKFVFVIVLSMIVVTSIFIAIVINTPDLRRMFRRHYLMFLILGLVLLLICHYSMFLSPCTRVPPCNILFLLLAVVAYCILAGNLSARYKTHLILYAAVATAGVVLVCLMLACTKFDFTSWLLYVVVIATVFSVITVIIFVSSLAMGHYPKPLHIAILIIGTLIQTVMLIIELQMILGGKSVELNENDYALGAFMLYTSIMSLFMNLLQLMDF